MTFSLQPEEVQIPTLDLTLLDEQRMHVDWFEELFQRFCRTGVMYVRPKLPFASKSEAFLNAMEALWRLPDERLQELNGERWNYQVGLTPPGTEVARDHSDWANTLSPHHRPLTVPGSGDPKWRLMWPVGKRPRRSMWPTVNANVPTPAAFMPYAEALDRWGQTLLRAGKHFLRAMCIGAGLPARTLEHQMHSAPHILGSTGSKLKEVPVGTVQAAVHYDFNLITVHGRSRFPILICWTNDGIPFVAHPPEGHLLIQAGKMWQHITGGAGHYGRHEVVMTPDGRDLVATALAEGRTTWRTSSNLFMHLNTGWRLRPLGRFATAEAMERYPSIYVGDYEMAELAAIGLASPDDLRPAALRHYRTLL